MQVPLVEWDDLACVAGFGGEGNWSFRLERNARARARVSLVPKTPFSFPFQTPATQARDHPVCSLIY